MARSGWENLYENVDVNVCKITDICCITRIVHCWHYMYRRTNNFVVLKFYKNSLHKKRLFGTFKRVEVGAPGIQGAHDAGLDVRIPSRVTRAPPVKRNKNKKINNACSEGYYKKFYDLLCLVWIA